MGLSVSKRRIREAAVVNSLAGSGTAVAPSVASVSTALAAKLSATITSPSGGQVVRWNGSAWVNAGIQASDVPTLNQNTTGTAANVTGSSNSTLTTLSALSLPSSQVTGLGTAAALNVPASGDAASGEVVKGSDSRLSDSRTPTTHTHDDRYYTEGEINTALAAKLSATITSPSSGQVVRWNGSAWVNAGIQASDVPTLNQNTTGTAANVTASSNSTLTTLSALSLPISQVTGLDAASQAEMEAGTETAVRRMSPLRVAQAIAALAGGDAYRNVWASDAVEAFTGGVYKAILTTSSLAVGCYEVTALINTKRATAATVGTRWIAGTASLAGASGDALGHAMLEGSTITQITLSSTSPWTTSQAARFSSADGATHLWRLAIEVTSAGTVSLQMYLNATNNVTIERGSFVIFKKVA